MNTSEETASIGRKLIEMADKSSLPRERAVKQGFAGLSDREIMAILLGTGVHGKNVLDLSDEILRDNDGHLSKIASMTCSQMTQRYKGIGPSKALTVLAALELGKRASRDAAEIEGSRKDMSSPEIIYRYMRQRFDGLDHEEFWILLLNRAMRAIGDFCVSKGGMAATVVDNKLIIRQMLDNGAMGVVLCHNHPSGNLMPSSHDDSLTRHIKSAAEIFEMRVVDHLIFTASGYYSYSDHGRL